MTDDSTSDCRKCRRLDASSDRGLARFDWLKASERMLEQAEHIETDHPKDAEDAKDCKIMGLLFRGLNHLLVTGDSAAAIRDFGPAAKLAESSTDKEYAPIITAMQQTAQGLELSRSGDRAQGITVLQTAWRVFAEWPRTEPGSNALLDFMAREVQLVITEATGLALIADGDPVDARPYLEQAATQYEKRAKVLPSPAGVILRAYCTMLRLLPDMKQCVSLTNNWELDRAEPKWAKLSTALQKERRRMGRLRGIIPPSMERIVHDIRGTAAMALSMSLLNLALLRLTEAKLKFAIGFLDIALDELAKCRSHNAKIKNVPVAYLYDLDALQLRLENIQRLLRPIKKKLRDQ